MKSQVVEYVGAHGNRLVAEVAGDPTAPSLVLLHGGGQTRHSWQKAMYTFAAKGYHVVNFDARGHGDSQWVDDGDYSFETLAADLRAVVATLPTKPALVGASMGGATSLILLGSDPDAASALVLVDYVPHVRHEGRERILAFMRQYSEGFASLEEASAAVHVYNPRRRETTLSGLMKNLRQHADGRLHWHWDPRLLESVEGTASRVQASKLDRAAARIKIPAILMRGLQSDVVSDDGVIQLKSVVPHLEVFDVPHASHMVSGDDNDAFNEGLEFFLLRHRNSAAIGQSET